MDHLACITLVTVIINHSGRNVCERVKSKLIYDNFTCLQYTNHWTYSQKFTGGTEKVLMFACRRLNHVWIICLGVRASTCRFWCKQPMALPDPTLEWGAFQKAKSDGMLIYLTAYINFSGTRTLGYGWLALCCSRWTKYGVCRGALSEL